MWCGADSVPAIQGMVGAAVGGRTGFVSRPAFNLRDFFFGKLGTGMKDEISRQRHLPASQNGLRSA
jgi:hypothetical protein